MKVRVYTINSFAKIRAGGNPAGVVLNADVLSESDMQKIATQVGFSETAFVMESEQADFKVRFFTPSEEVDLCGHATIGTFVTLAKQNIILPGMYTQETKAGILQVELKEDLSVMMAQKLPTFCEMLNKAEIADSLNIGLSEIDKDLPVQIVSTGLKDIIVPIRTKETLNSMQFDLKKIEAVSFKYGALGYHLFVLDEMGEAQAVCRNLAPVCGIPEEAATGTANGALACYLFKYHKVKALSKLIFKQGYTMGRPSEISVSLETEENNIRKVTVGGRALNLDSVEIVV